MGGAGPLGLVDGWSAVRTDSAVHAVFMVRQWPRVQSHPGFLAPLLLGAPGRCFCWVAEPVGQARALRGIRGAKAEAVAESWRRARIGRVDDEADQVGLEDVTRREQDLVAGHAALRAVGLLTVSAATVEELDAACRDVAQQAGQAMLELRLLVGQQAAALVVAALPLARRAS